MDENLLTALLMLKEALAVDERLLALRFAERQLVQDQRVQELVQKRNSLAEDYYALRRKGPSDALKKKKEAYLLLRRELQALPSVFFYEEAYARAKTLWAMVDEALFRPYLISPFMEES